MPAITSKMTDFREIKTFPHCSYHIHVGWTYLEDQLKSDLELGLDLDPDFQRGHVWTEAQQSAYCEYILRNGRSGRDIYFNCTGWDDGARGPFVIVDGKQRLQAVRQFMHNRIRVFGSYLSEYANKPNMLIARFSWNIAALETRREVLEWYLDFNSGGTDHAPAELARVQKLLEAEL